MKKIVLLMLLIIALSNIAYAMRTCQDVIEPDTDCEILTPITTCGTYDLYNSSHELSIDDGVMSQIGSTGVYNFTFNQANEGTYKIITCGNDTATIGVATYSQKVIYDNNLVNSSSIRGDIVTVQADLDNPSQYKADVSSLATLSGIESNKTSIETKIDTLSNITVQEIDLQLNASHSTGNWSATASTATAIVNSTEIANAVWDLNLSNRYPQADDDNFIANLAGEKMLQALRFIIQLLFR